MSESRDWWVTAGNFISDWFWQGLVAIAILVVGLFFIHPFDKVEDPSPEDIATAWNKSIGRLGILPLYPPTEDFRVGDVLAVVADSDNVPLLGKAVRVARIDLREKILDASSGPVFSETADLAAGAPFRRQERKEQSVTSDNKISLALTAFPGVSISHITRTSATAGSTAGWFGSARGGEQREQIQIKGAETYGVSTVDAIIKLNNWCRADDTKKYCQDDFVRKALAFAVSDRVLATTEGKFATRLQLQLVTRVYLTRQIEQRRYSGTAGGAVAQILSDPAKPLPEATPGKPGTAPSEVEELVSSSGDNLGKGLTASGATGAKVAFLRSDGAGVYLSETFQRPIAFGYRAVTITLTPAEPKKEPLL